MKSLLEQNGGVTILLTMAILTSIIIVSISVITLRINRLRFTSNIATATKTLQEAKNLREEIFFHVLIEEGDLSQYFTEGGGKCPDWKNWKGSMEYCIEEDVLATGEYRIHMRFIKRNITKVLPFSFQNEH
jgi:hypothetical protein